MRWRTPQPADGAALWRLVRDAGTLELNSPYTYALLGSDFAATCLVAVDDDDAPVGAVLGYRPPPEPETAFVWQVAVHPTVRGRGVGVAMLCAWHALPGVCEARWITATVAPDNRASRALFRRLAVTLGVPCEIRPRFEAGCFPVGHGPEPEVRLGPFRPPPRDP